MLPIRAAGIPLSAVMIRPLSLQRT